MKIPAMFLAATLLPASAVSLAQQSVSTAPDDFELSVRGSGEVILFLHGGIIAGPPESFLNQTALANYQLVSYNRRGYPGSPQELGPPDDYLQRHASDAATILSNLGIDGAHVVGHSSGGTIALQLALSNPGLVRSLVLLEPVIPPGATAPELLPDATDRTQIDQAQLIEYVMAGEYVAALDHFFATQAGMPEWRNSFSPAEVRQGEAYAPTFFNLEGRSFETWVPPQGLVSESLPALYVSASESADPAESIDALSVWFPRIEVVEIPNVGHEFYATDPESVAAAIADFLERY